MKVVCLSIAETSGAAWSLLRQRGLLDEWIAKASLL